MFEYILPKYQLLPRLDYVNGLGKATHLKATIRGMGAIKAILRDWSCKIAACALILLGLYQCIINETTHIWPWVLAIIIPLVFYPLLHALIGILFSSSKVVYFDQNQIIFRRGLVRHVFELSLPVQFTLLPHCNAAYEEEWHTYRHQRDQLKGKVKRRKRYFQNSFHIIISSMHKKAVIGTIYDEVHAKKNLDVLNSALAQAKAMRGTGQGLPCLPEDEWQKRPGEL